MKDQRVYKKKLDRGDRKPRTTAERVARLAALGLVWDPPNTGGTPKEAEWEVQLARLATYKAEHGDCSMPRSLPEDSGLANWVSNQRQRKRRLDRGEHSEGMTAERAARLTALGFVWNPRNAEADGKPAPTAAKLAGKSNLNVFEAAWEAQLARLAAYKAEHGDCNVTMRWAEDPKLDTWVNTQRKFKRKLDRGEPSEGMTAARAAKLDKLGFPWAQGLARRQR